MLDRREKFNEKIMEQLVILYTNGEKVTDIAKKLNVSRSTVYHWLNREDTRRTLEDARQIAISQANEIILKDVNGYIDDIKAIAKQKEDKRSSLSASMYLLDRILGRTTAKFDIEASTKQIEAIDDDVIDAEIDALDLDELE